MKKIVLVLVCTFLGVFLIGCNSKKEISDNFKNISPLEEKDIINKDENKLGIYGLAYYKGNLTDEELIDFYNEKVKESKFNYVKLVNQDDESEAYIYIGAKNNIALIKQNEKGELLYTLKKMRIEGGKIVVRYTKENGYTGN